MKTVDFKNWMKSLRARMAYETGSPGTYAPNGAIALFHRVNDNYPGNTLTVSPRDFDRYLRLFRTYFDVVPLAKIVDLLEAGESLSGRLAITFDDGYADNYEYAAPLLSRYGLPCTFFVVTDFIESNKFPFWDEKLPTPPGWMTWDQVSQLHAAGFEVASHTMGHPDLGTVRGAEAREEIFGSKRDLEARLGAPVSMFSYPFGGLHQMSESNRKLVEEAGYRACFSAYGGVVPAGTSPFRVRRHPISDYHIAPWTFLYDLDQQHRVFAGA